MRELADARCARRSRRQRPAAPETEVVEAYEAFSRGLLNRSAETFESLDRAVWLFERAVTIDPAYARAHVELGAARTRTKASYLSMPELRQRAVVEPAARDRAAAGIRARLARARRGAGRHGRRTPRGWPRSGARWRSIPRTPAPARRWGARSSSAARASPRRSPWFARALERNPKGGWYALQLAHCAALMRDFALGERVARQAMELQEAFLSGREGLFIAGAYMRAGHLAALQGRHAEAIAYFDRRSTSSCAPSTRCEAGSSSS